jgi:hypothetical protein
VILQSREERVGKSRHRMSRDSSLRRGAPRCAAHGRRARAATGRQKRPALASAWHD